jgi:hypothetical protein
LSWLKGTHPDRIRDLAWACYILALDRLVDYPDDRILKDGLQSLRLEGDGPFKFMLEVYNEIGGVTTVDSIFQYGTSANVICEALIYYLDFDLMTKYAPSEYMVVTEEAHSRRVSNSDDRIVRIGKNVPVKGIMSFLNIYLL